MTTQLWEPRERLTPWVVFDLERITWIVEQRRDDLTPDERAVVLAVARRLAEAVGQG